MTSPPRPNLKEMVTRERVEQIRRQMTTNIGSGIIIRTHKNFIACELLDYIDYLLRKTTHEHE